MTMHKSLRMGDRFGGKRNVLRRAERVQKGRKDGKLKEEDSVFGLPKLRIIKIKQKKKEKEAAAATPEAGAEAAAPAEGAPPAEAPKKEEKK
jgi:small basic protein (TIGR04137 family)